MDIEKGVNYYLPIIFCVIMLIFFIKTGITYKFKENDSLLGRVIVYGFIGIIIFAFFKLLIYLIGNTNS